MSSVISAGNFQSSHLSENARARTFPAFIAIVWKEYRENGKWALLASVALAAGLLWAIDKNKQVSGRTLNDIFAVTTFGMAVIGLGLGLLQVLPEKRRDQWAFLVHRPVNRGLLFLAKVVAGLTLVLLAGSIALIGAMLWIRAPGHIAAPYDWRLSLGGWADVLMGTGYYFAGLIIGLRDARWYGSRVMPLGMAVLGSIFVYAVPQFYHAVIVVGIVAAITGTAAWGCFRVGGAAPPRPWIASAALGLCVLVGISFVFIVAAGAVMSILLTRSWNYRYSSYAVNIDGNIVIQTQNFPGRSTTTDLSGTPLPDSNSLQGASLSVAPYAGDANPTDDIDSALHAYRTPDRYFRTVATNVSGEFWYYDERRFELLAYDWATARRIGAMGPSGFVAGDASPSEQFPGRWRNVWTSYDSYSTDGFMQFPTVIYEPDFERRRVTKFFSAPPGEKIIGFHLISSQDEYDTYALRSKLLKKSPSLMVVSTTGALYVWRALDRSPRLIALTYPREHFPSISVYPLPDNEYLLYYHAHREPGQPSENEIDHVVRLSGQGNVVNTTDLRPLAQSRFSPPIGEPIVAAICSPTILILAALRDWQSGQGILNELRNIDSAYLILIAAIASGLGSAGVTLLLARRQQTTRRWSGWIAGNVILGPVGLLTLISLTERTPRVTCPSCGKRRLVSHQHCEHCSAAFPLPASDGTEIFQD